MFWSTDISSPRKTKESYFFFNPWLKGESKSVVKTGIYGGKETLKSIKLFTEQVKLHDVKHMSNVC